jgi:hypothetical protein
MEYIMLIKKQAHSFYLKDTSFLIQFLKVSKPLSKINFVIFLHWAANSGKSLSHLV